MSDIPREMQEQISPRMEIISESERVAKLICRNMNDYFLALLHKKLMRTRKTYFTFSMDGLAYMVTRKHAIAVVKNEMAARP